MRPIDKLNVARRVQSLDSKFLGAIGRRLFRVACTALGAAEIRAPGVWNHVLDDSAGVQRREGGQTGADYSDTEFGSAEGEVRRRMMCREI